MPRLLLDDKLSPGVAIELRADSRDAVHIRERGRLGTSDAAVLKLAFVEDRILMTTNVADFRRLAAALDGGFSLEEIPTRIGLPRSSRTCHAPMRARGLSPIGGILSRHVAWT